MDCSEPGVGVDCSEPGVGVDCREPVGLSVGRVDCKVESSQKQWN